MSEPANARCAATHRAGAREAGAVVVVFELSRPPSLHPSASASVAHASFAQRFLAGNRFTVSSIETKSSAVRRATSTGNPYTISVIMEADAMEMPQQVH